MPFCYNLYLRGSILRKNKLIKNHQVKHYRTCLIQFTYRYFLSTYSHHMAYHTRRIPTASNIARVGCIRDNHNHRPRIMCMLIDFFHSRLFLYNLNNPCKQYNIENKPTLTANTGKFLWVMLNKASYIVIHTYNFKIITLLGVFINDFCWTIPYI